MPTPTRYGEKATCPHCGKPVTYSKRPFTDGMAIYGYWHWVRCGCTSSEEYFSPAEAMKNYRVRLDNVNEGA
jgi:rRNA maturation protein Nop10